MHFRHVLRRSVAAAVVCIAVAPAAASANHMQMNVTAATTPIGTTHYFVTWTCSAGSALAASTSIDCGGFGLTCPGPFCASTSPGQLVPNGSSATAGGSASFAFILGGTGGVSCSVTVRPPLTPAATRQCAA